MWISVISAMCCFAIGVILFTPLLRQFIFYQPVAVFFIFEGIWSLINGILMETGLDFGFMIWIQCIGIIVLALVIFYLTFINYNSSKKDITKYSNDKNNFNVDK